GEREAHRPQLGQPARAAVLATAAAHTVEPLCLVARADLAQLDARVEQAREVAHQRQEVQAMLGGEVHGELLTVPMPQGFRDLSSAYYNSTPFAQLSDSILRIYSS